MFPNRIRKAAKALQASFWGICPGLVLPETPNVGAAAVAQLPKPWRCFSAALTALLLIGQIALNTALFFINRQTKHFENHANPDAEGVSCGWTACYFLPAVVLGFHTRREPIRSRGNIFGVGAVSW